MVHSNFCDCLTAFGDNQLPPDSHSAWKLHASACMHACTHQFQSGSWLSLNAFQWSQKILCTIKSVSSLENLYGFSSKSVQLLSPVIDSSSSRLQRLESDLNLHPPIYLWKKNRTPTFRSSFWKKSFETSDRLASSWYPCCYLTKLQSWSYFLQQ